MTDRIYGFDGENRWLSNFWDEGGGFSNEHRFQSLKATTLNEALWVNNSLTPGEAKRRGRQVTLRDNWESEKVYFMMFALQDKFTDPRLRAQLLATGDAELIEANTWGDTFWGVDRETGQGENWLGSCLMNLRAEFVAEDKWVAESA